MIDIGSIACRSFNSLSNDRYMFYIAYVAHLILWVMIDRGIAFLTRLLLCVMIDIDFYMAYVAHLILWVMIDIGSIEPRYLS